MCVIVNFCLNLFGLIIIYLIIALTQDGEGRDPLFHILPWGSGQHSLSQNDRWALRRVALTAQVHDLDPDHVVDGMLRGQDTLNREARYFEGTLRGKGISG